MRFWQKSKVYLLLMPSIGRLVESGTTKKEEPKKEKPACSDC